MRDNKHPNGNGEEDKRKDSHSEKDAPVKGHVLSEEEFQEFLRWKASQVIDVAVNEVLEDLATKVMEEKDEPMEDDTENPRAVGFFSV